MEGQENTTRVDEQAGSEVIDHEPEGNRERSGCYYDGRRIFRVPDHVRRANMQDYIPRIVSFGPYYHGSDELRLAEELKPKVVEYFVSESGKDRQFFYDKVFQVIHEIRLCYDEFIINKYDDATLAEMMIRDAFFLIYLMKGSLNELKDLYLLVLDNLGISSVTLLQVDMLLLENQIPLSIIGLFASLLCDEDEWPLSVVLRYFVAVSVVKERDITQFPFGKDRKQPLHLLDIHWRFFVTPKELMELQVDMQDEEHINIIDVARLLNRPFRSVTDLKTKGIYFIKSDGSQAPVREIQFRSWKFFGELRLPFMMLDTGNKVIISNLIAFEVSPGGTGILGVTSYINFIKSLVVSPKDVKELREKEIVFSKQDNDEDVMKQIKGINTYEWDDPLIFNQVKMDIEKHCNRKMATWMAELVNTYFRNPWTFLGLLAATILLCLTVVQTYYAVNPKSK